MLASLERGALDGYVAVSPLWRSGDHAAGEGAGSGTTLEDGEVVRFAEPTKFRLDPPGQNGAEQRTDFW